MVIKKVIQRRVGQNLAHVLAQTLAKDYYTAVLELVSNSYDADAENVYITLNCLDDILDIEDDGFGMDKKGIESFFRMGDSEKLKNPISPKGRRKIGKKGIATVLLEYLAGSYVLQTWKQKKKFVVRENFDDRKDKLRVKPSLIKIPKYGTKISMSNLKFDKNTLDIDKLKTFLEWRAPCLPDFNIYINNVLVPKRSVVTYASEYVVDFSIEDIGCIQGSIFYRKGGSHIQTPGIFIYVNGRAVGDPQSFNSFFTSSMLSRTVGMINADCLDKFIGFDRSRFSEDSIEYQKIRNAIKKVITSIGNDASKGGVSPRAFYQDKSRITALINNALGSAESKLNKSFLKQAGIKPKKLELIVDEDNRWRSRHEPEKDVIYINAANPQLSIMGSYRSGHEIFESLFIMLSLSAVADNDLSKDKKSRAILARLSENIFSSAERIFPGSSIKNTVRSFISNEAIVVPSSQIALNPYRLYTITEISYMTGLHRNILIFLYACRALKLHSKRTEYKFRADAIKTCLKKIDSYVPVGIAIRDPEYFRPRKRYYGDIFPSLEKTVFSFSTKPAYLINAGTSGQPFMWVKKEKIPQLKKYLARKNVKSI